MVVKKKQEQNKKILSPRCHKVLGRGSGKIPYVYGFRSCFKICETKYHNFLSTLYVFTDSKLGCIIVCQGRSRKVEYFVGTIRVS